MTGGSGVSYIEEVLPDIETAAQRVAKKWPQITTADDLYQELVLHFLEAPGSLEKLAGLSSEKRLARLVAIGHERASEARDKLDYFSGQFNYSVDEVRKLLERGAILTRVRDFDAASIDVQASMEVLHKRNRDYWSILVERYVTGIKFDRESNEAKHLLPRAVESLTTLMNRARSTQSYEFTNGGRYRNNKAAVSQTRLDYEGDNNDTF